MGDGYLFYRTAIWLIGVGQPIIVPNSRNFCLFCFLLLQIISSKFFELWNRKWVWHVRAQSKNLGNEIAYPQRYLWQWFSVPVRSASVKCPITTSADQGEGEDERMSIIIIIIIMIIIINLDVSFSDFRVCLSRSPSLALSLCSICFLSLCAGDWFWDYSRSRWMLVRFPGYVDKHTESHRPADRESKPVDSLYSARLACAPLELQQAWQYTGGRANNYAPIISKDHLGDSILLHRLSQASV